MTAYTKELLRRAWREGIGPFLSQVYMTVQAKLLGKRYYVWELRDSDFCAQADDARICIESYINWNEVPAHVKDTIDKDLAEEYWGRPIWFDLGWRMWVALMNGRAVLITWTRAAAQCEDFFFPLSPDCVLIWQTVTVSAYRGMGILPAAYRLVCAELFESGVRRIYSSSRVNNLPMKNASVKAGFKQIGVGLVRRRTRNGVWFPAIRPFTDG